MHYDDYDDGGYDIAVPDYVPDMAFAILILANPEGYDADGNMFVTPESLEPMRVPVVAPDVCNHQTLLCGDCIESWQSDYDIETDADADAILSL